MSYNTNVPACMRKWFVWLTGLLLVAGCSSDSDDKETLPTGHFIASNDAVVLSVELVDGICSRLTAFDDGTVFSQTNSPTITTTGQYPNYTYSGDGFTMACAFPDANRFTATVTGKLPRLYSGDYVEVSGTFQFSRYDGVLDANGDGVIDK